MADEQQNKGPVSQTTGNQNPVPTMEATTSVPTLSFDSADNSVEESFDTISQDVGNPQEADGDELPLELQEGSEEDVLADGAEKSETETDTSASEEGEPLPAFDLGNEEVIAAYDAKYLAEGPDGHKVINLDAFNDSISKNFKDGKTDISADERAYVKATMGVSDELIDQHIEGLVAKAAASDEKIFAHAGSQENFVALHEFAAKEYNAAQKAAYNAAAAKAAKGDFTDLFEQIDLLSLRAQRAGFEGLKAPASKQNTVGAGRLRRPSSPVKTAGNGVTTRAPAAPDTSVFASTEEHRIAQNEAIASRDQSKINAVRQKLSRSIAKGLKV
jgi:hypothetical protein